MAAGLGFKDFTTGEVLTAADVDGYLMQGVWVFASAAARDAAVTSPQEGNFAYLKDTNVTTYYTGSAWANLDTTGMTNPMTTTGDTIYSSSGSTPARLGIGTTGQVLTVAGGVPSWATAASGGGMTLLSTTTLSGATTTISSISTAYKNLFGVVFQATNATASGAFRIAPNAVTNISTQLIGGVIKRAQYMLLATADNADTRPTYNDSTNAWTFQINNYSSTTATVKPFQVYGSFFADQNGFQPTISGGGIENTTAITSLVFSNSGGNHNGGTVLLYGVA